MNKWINKKYHIVGTVPKYNPKIIETQGKIDTTNTDLHDRSVSWLGIVISVNNLKWINWLCNEYGQKIYGVFRSIHN
jgi:hypothetical protein